MSKNTSFTILGVAAFIALMFIFVRLKSEITEIKSIPTSASSKEIVKDIPNTKVVEDNLLTQEFTYPYPIQWNEGDISFSLIATALGEITIPVSNFPMPNASKYEGKKINALALKIKAKNNGASAFCVDMNLRRLINEEGDLVAPENRQFYFKSSSGCSLLSKTTDEYTIIFAVPSNENDFHITTGGKSNIFFEVKKNEGGIKINNESVSRP